MRLSLTRWRLLLLAAFVLLAGALGAGAAVARTGIGQTARECPESGGCDQRLTAPAQPALIQVALRIDGKALTGGSTGFATLPGAAGLPAFTQIAATVPAGVITSPRRPAAGPGQPRGPPPGR